MRRSCTWYPTGNSTCSPTGTRAVRCLIAGNDWLDLSSMRVVQTVRNLHATRSLNPRTDGCDTGESVATSPALLWDRQRLFASGELIDDQLYASHVEMFLRKLSPGNFNTNQDGMGWSCNPALGLNTQLSVTSTGEGGTLPGTY